MDANQKINCTVLSCKYNNGDSKKCMLESIKVAPIEDVENTQTADESMCASYQFDEE